MINLDTQIVIYALEGRLNRDEERALRDEAWCASDIVIWELGSLYRDGRIKQSLDHPELNRLLARMTIWPITRDIAKALQRLDFRSDPADEIIAATSLVHDVPLITRDQRILRSMVVPLGVR